MAKPLSVDSICMNFRRYVGPSNVPLHLTWKYMMYSAPYLMLDGSLQNGLHLTASLPQLRKQISGRLGYSASKFSQEKTLTTVIRTSMCLFCCPRALIPIILGP